MCKHRNCGNVVTWRLYFSFLFYDYCKKRSRIVALITLLSCEILSYSVMNCFGVWRAFKLIALLLRLDFPDGARLSSPAPEATHPHKRRPLPFWTQVCFQSECPLNHSSSSSTPSISIIDGVSISISVSVSVSISISISSSSSITLQCQIKFNCRQKVTCILCGNEETHPISLRPWPLTFNRKSGGS